MAILNNQPNVIEGYCYPDEKQAFYNGGNQLVVYKAKLNGTVKMQYTKLNVIIKDTPNFWILTRY